MIFHLGAIARRHGAIELRDWKALLPARCSGHGHLGDQAGQGGVGFAALAFELQLGLQQVGWKRFDGLARAPAVGRSFLPEPTALPLSA